MPSFRVQLLGGRDELLAASSSWNDLWQRSQTTHPTCRAEHVAIWLDSFLGSRQFAAITVRDEDRLVAALPLIQERRAGLMASAALPNNVWSMCGDLLLDPNHRQTGALDELCGAILELGWPLLWLRGVHVERPDWRALLGRLAARGLAPCTQPMYPVGLVDITHDWQRYFASRSRNHRRQVRRSAERLRSSGGGELVMFTGPDAGDVVGLMRRGFEIEQRSWKGRSGSCVLKEPEIFEFFCRQAEALAESGHLHLAFLEHRGRAIAFEYGMHAKRVYFSPKVGYDEAFGEMSPGLQLRSLLIEHFHAESEIDLVDFHGPLVPATARWATRGYGLGRAICALRGPVSRAVVACNQRLRPWYRGLRARLVPGGEPWVEPRPIAVEGPARQGPELEELVAGAH